MSMKVQRVVFLTACFFVVAACADAEEFQLLFGVDQGLWPAPFREVSPSMAACCPWDFGDGDRLAGNAPAGQPVEYLGNGTPLFAPNEFGSLSFFFRRGVYPEFGSYFPWQGVDFLGGPLLDLDGDASDAGRSLVPVFGETAVPIPGRTSYIDLSFNKAGGTVTLNNLDATGTNEGGYFISPGIATTVNVMAGTDGDGSLDLPPPNPTIDTRVGTLTPYTGTSGTLTGVYRIQNVGYEFWQDTILVESGTADTLGTFQFLGRMRGWLIERYPTTGQFPALAAEGLGNVLWPLVDTSMVGQSLTTAHGLAGGSATITRFWANVDDMASAGNGGTGPTALGSYLDTIVVPRVSPLADAFIYLEAAGFGINNSGDPLYIDSVSYDVVFLAQRAPRLDLGNFAAFQRCFTGAGPVALPGDCGVYDFDGDVDVDLDDVAAFRHMLTGP